MNLKPIALVLVGLAVGSVLGSIAGERAQQAQFDAFVGTCIHDKNQQVRLLQEQVFSLNMSAAYDRQWNQTRWATEEKTERKIDSLTRALQRCESRDSIVVKLIYEPAAQGPGKVKLFPLTVDDSRVIINSETH